MPGLSNLKITKDTVINADCHPPGWSPQFYIDIDEIRFFSNMEISIRLMRETFEWLKEHAENGRYEGIILLPPYAFMLSLIHI